MVTDRTLECRNVSRTYRAEDGVVWALKEVSMTAASGQITVLAGPSGSGKSTLLRILAGIDLPLSGTVTIGGRDLTAMRPRDRRRFRARYLAYLFQDPAANLLSYLSVWDHLALAARVRRTDPEMSLLESLEIEELANELPATLSAGQQQRAALATAMVGDPALILADEPTAELDAVSANLAVDGLVRLRRLGATMVITSHDAQVISIADAVVRLERGTVMA
ncbi:MAG: ATP-binding cassette domain-containing protein [Acidimicrobiia bacterium]|nr:ATP-binding cassette domain-containing protein [Acidimicrobiia bacterium]